jgi:hypothetical protein
MLWRGEGGRNEADANSPPATPPRRGTRNFVRRLRRSGTTMVAIGQPVMQAHSPFLFRTPIVVQLPRPGRSLRRLGSRARHATDYTHCFGTFLETNSNFVVPALQAIRVSPVALAFRRHRSQKVVSTPIRIVRGRKGVTWSRPVAKGVPSAKRLPRVSNRLVTPAVSPMAPSAMRAVTPLST